MSHLSRRSLVTSAAALPALAVPAAVAEAIGPNHPDAELLRLGVEAIDRVQNDKWNAACAAAGLLTPDIDPDAGPTECSPHVDMFN